ncbi:MAG: tetratricopeptide repeat protein [Acidobacteria bacterium]|nr:tetratricopeptide repeat protein [Acidobacteriota bacterium]
MKPESIAFGIAGVVFGLVAGWIIGSQQATLQPGTAAPVAASAPASAPAQGSSAPAAAVLDDNKVKALTSVAEQQPGNAQARVELGNLYFDAERYADAIKWYAEAFKIDPKDVNVSTDLGVSYYYTNQPDRALAQFEESLRIDPKHTKTLLNQGIVRAFGKQDLAGAEQSWQQVLQLEPNSPEGQAAKRALDSLKSAHPGGSTAAAPKPGA